MSSESLAYVPLKLIRHNPVALREVERESEGYLGLVDSIRQQGVLNPIVVRKVVDKETGEEVYGLIDGLHRFTAAGDAGLDSIPANVTSLSDAEVLEAQIISNIHRIETRPVEYSKQLQRMMAADPTMTMSQLATKLSKSPTWLSERLGLLNLNETISPLVDEGKINLTNAYVLSKLPKDEQVNFVDNAMTMVPGEFSGLVMNRKKEIEKAKRQGRDPAAMEFVATPHLRKPQELKDELSAAVIGPELCRRFNLTTAEEGFAMAVKYATHMDPVSVELAKKRFDEQKAEIDAKRKANADVRNQKRIADATTKAARLQLQADTIAAGGDVKAALAAFDAEHAKSE